VIEVVLDASVVLGWFGGRDDGRAAEALAVRAADEAPASWSWSPPCSRWRS